MAGPRAAAPRDRPSGAEAVRRTRAGHGEENFYGDAEPLFGKPSTVLLFCRLPPPTFGGVLCPNYEVYE
ncbi:MAG: hypothetical protein ACRDGW_01600 [Actinomycetota bacterium]